MRPRCSILTGGFDFSGCGDCTSCPPIERAEMSNSEPSAIVLQGMPCIGGLYISFDSNGETGSLKVRMADNSLGRLLGLPRRSSVGCVDCVLVNLPVFGCGRSVGPLCNLDCEPKNRRRPSSCLPPLSRGILSLSPLLALLYDFAQIHNWTYFNRSKSMLKAWKL
jgi:hypothetical protein